MTHSDFPDLITHHLQIEVLMTRLTLLYGRRVTRGEVVRWCVDMCHRLEDATAGIPKTATEIKENERSDRN